MNPNAVPQTAARAGRGWWGSFPWINFTGPRSEGLREAIQFIMKGCWRVDPSLLENLSFFLCVFLSFIRSFLPHQGPRRSTLSWERRWRAFRRSPPVAEPWGRPADCALTSREVQSVAMTTSHTCPTACSLCSASVWVWWWNAPCHIRHCSLVSKPGGWEASRG